MCGIRVEQMPVARSADNGFTAVDLKSQRNATSPAFDPGETCTSGGKRGRKCPLEYNFFSHDGLRSVSWSTTAIQTPIRAAAHSSWRTSDTAEQKLASPKAPRMGRHKGGHNTKSRRLISCGSCRSVNQDANPGHLSMDCAKSTPTHTIPHAGPIIFHPRAHRATQKFRTVRSFFGTPPCATAENSARCGIFLPFHPRAHRATFKSGDVTAFEKLPPSRAQGNPSSPPRWLLNAGHSRISPQSKHLKNPVKHLACLQ